MEGNDKKRIYITAGIIAALLLIVVIMIATSGRNDDDTIAEVSSNSGAHTTGVTQEQTEDADAAVSTDGGSLEEETGAMETEEGAPLPQGSGAERGATKVEAAPAQTSAPSDASGAASTAPKVIVPKEGYIFYEPGRPKLKASYQGVAYDTEAELKVLFDYWDAKNLDAVRDLIALPRYEAISATLKGSNDFYYHGARDAAGKPHGKGVAVYADNQYYCGDFANGVRAGKGEWLQRYPSYMNDVMIEHYYTGEWAGDLPNGKGQDHFEYDENKMNDEQLFLLNAIGTFKDGAYDGEMYIMIEETDGTYTEWTGNCKAGVFDVFGSPDDHARVAILRSYHDEDHYIWVKPDRNAAFKVAHLIAP